MMTRLMRVPRTLVAVAAIGAMALAASGPAGADPGASTGGKASDGYNAIPSKVRANVPSVSWA